MQIIKIYNKDFGAITSLTNADFNTLRWQRNLGEIGDADFVVRLDGAKVTTQSIQKFNRIEIYADGEIQFVGVILSITVNMDTARVRCKELGYLLRRRLLGESFVANATVATVVTNILSTINGEENTGITLGDVSGAIGSVNMTFKYVDAFSALKQICKATNNQFMVTPERELVVAEKLGIDKSAEAVLRYNAKQVTNSNILNFDVEDSGENLITKAFGKSNALTAEQENTTSRTKYGLLETFRDFRVVNTQGVLDDFTEAEINDGIYSPNIQLNPDADDNFTVADLVRLRLRNALIDIDDSFQVLGKAVEYKGKQKLVRVRINNLSDDFATRLAEREARLDLLEKQV